MTRYRMTFVVMFVVLAGLIAGQQWTSGWIDSSGEKVRTEDANKQSKLAKDKQLEERQKNANRTRPLISAFIARWQPFMQPFSGEKDFVGSFLALIDSEALMAGVATAQKVAPTPIDYRVNGKIQRMQQVSVTVTGDLQACLVWLGSMEEKVPYARVEAWQLSSFGSERAAMRLTFVHPAPPDKKATPVAAPAAASE